jgi:hypothetical protein
MKTILSAPGVVNVAAALVLAAVLPGRADEPIVDRTATLHLRNGSSVTGILVSAGSRRVAIRRPGWQREGPLRYVASCVRWLESRGNFFALDAKTGTWELNKEAGKQRAREQRSSPQEANRARTTPAVQSVEAEGTGQTVEEARQDAIRVAVRKAAGALVVSDLKLENDRVIRDRVLLYSDGVIAPGSYRELKRARDGSLWTVRISVRVLSRKLAGRLEAAGMATREVNGPGLAAAVLVRAEARAQAAKLVEEVIDEFLGVFTARAAALTARDYDEERRCLRLRVQVGVDPGRFRRWLRRALAILNRVCVARNGFLSGPLAGPRRPHWSGLAMDLDAGMRRLSLAGEDGRSWFLWVLTGVSPDLARTSWMVYQFDCSRDGLSAVLARKPALLVRLLDEHGKALASRTVRLPHLTRWQTSEHAILAPVRLSCWRGRAQVSLVEQVQTEVRLDLKDLARLRRTECSVSWK